MAASDYPVWIELLPQSLFQTFKERYSHECHVGGSAKRSRSGRHPEHRAHVSGDVVHGNGMVPGGRG